MITDVSGVRLTPGNNGRDCVGNGKHYDAYGKLIDCLCDECDYMMCCFMVNDQNSCTLCDDELCPRNSSKSTTSPF